MSKDNWKNITAVKNKESVWDKTLPTDVRREIVLKAYHGNELAAARALKNLANATRDKEAKVLAATDAVFLLKMSQEFANPHVASQPYNDGRLPKKEGFNKNEAE
jgi:hypothetical protein